MEWTLLINMIICLILQRANGLHLNRKEIRKNNFIFRSLPLNTQFAPLPVIPLRFDTLKSHPINPFGPPPPPPPPPPPSSMEENTEEFAEVTTVEPPDFSEDSTIPLPTLPPPPYPDPPPPIPVHGSTLQLFQGMFTTKNPLPTPPPHYTTTKRSRPAKDKGKDNDDGLLYLVTRQDRDGGYFFDFLTSTSIHRQEQGFFKKVNGKKEAVHVKTGLYQFTSPEGRKFRMDYLADENGYKAYETILT